MKKDVDYYDRFALERSRSNRSAKKMAQSSISPSHPEF
jgi:hypothetical protein